MKVQGASAHPGCIPLKAGVFPPKPPSTERPGEDPCPDRCHQTWQEILPVTGPGVNLPGAPAGCRIVIYTRLPSRGGGSGLTGHRRLRRCAQEMDQKWATGTARRCMVLPLRCQGPGGRASSGHPASVAGVGCSLQPLYPEATAVGSWRKRFEVAVWGAVPSACPLGIRAPIPFSLLQRWLPGCPSKSVRPSASPTTLVSFCVERLEAVTSRAHLGLIARLPDELTLPSVSLGIVPLSLTTRVALKSLLCCSYNLSRSPRPLARHRPTQVLVLHRYGLSEVEG